MAYIRNANLKSSQREARQVEHIWLHVILRQPIQNSPSCHATYTAKQYSAFFIVKLLIETYSQRLYSQDNNGMITLHHVVDRPCIDCFRAVLYSGNVEATTMDDRYGRTPLH
mmetsp:Transcript_21598/g.39164  ORF Transcript_21598/g.39164 Transcript_21598/m.39164 type:complete len:112 (+) Transcript_21598:579-914(+)